MVITVRPRVLVLDDWDGQMERTQGIRQMREFADVTFLPGRLIDANSDELAGAHVVLAIRERTQLDATVLARMPSLELVLQTGGHAYHLDQRWASAHGIVVALGRNARSGGAAIPELTFALAIGVLRRLPEAQRAMDRGTWPTLVGRTLSGRNMGILGMGRYGVRVSEIARAFGMHVAAWARPSTDTPSTQQGVEAPGAVPRLGLDDLLAWSDVVSLHLRLSDESRGLIGRRAFTLMKSEAVLINTARGAIVDEPALLEALRTQSIAGAGLDVFAEEPLPGDHPLRGMPNLVLTPHLGWTVQEAFEDFSRIAATQLRDYLGHQLGRTQLLDPAVQVPEHGRTGGLVSENS